MKHLSDDVAKAYLDKHYAGRQVAFAPHHFTGPTWALSIVVKDEAGHEPLPWQMAHGSEDQMHQLADHLNDAVLKLTTMQAAMYVASTMNNHRIRAG